MILQYGILAVIFNILAALILGLGIAIFSLYMADRYADKDRVVSWMWKRS